MSVLVGMRYTVKKAFQYSRPQPGCHLPNSPLGGTNDVINKLFRPRESLVNDIPAGDGNIEKPFLRCSESFDRGLMMKIVDSLPVPCYNCEEEGNC